MIKWFIFLSIEIFLQFLKYAQYKLFYSSFSFELNSPIYTFNKNSNTFEANIYGKPLQRGQTERKADKIHRYNAVRTNRKRTFSSTGKSTLRRGPLDFPGFSSRFSTADSGKVRRAPEKPRAQITPFSIQANEKIDFVVPPLKTLRIGFSFHCLFIFWIIQLVLYSVRLLRGNIFFL